MPDRWWKNTVTAGTQPAELKVTDHRRHTPMGPKIVGNRGSGFGSDWLSVVVLQQIVTKHCKVH